MPSVRHRVRPWRLVGLAVLAATSLGAQCLAAQVRGFERAFVDTRCAPCDDFFRYANGAWLDTAQVPADAQMTGIRREMEERTAAAIIRILDRLRRTPDAPDPSDRALGAFYASCMDSTRADQAGSRAIADEFGRLAQLSSRAGLAAALARLHRIGIAAPFQIAPEIDPARPTRTIARIQQAGLGLPDRDYYLGTDSAAAALRREYTDHVARTLRLLGSPEAAARTDAERVLRFETRLARASMTVAELGVPDSVYHPVAVRDLAALAPSLDWAAYLRGLGVPALAAPGDSLDLGQPVFLREVGDLVRDAPIADWTAYLRWQLANALAPMLGDRFTREQFAFDRRFSGADALPPRQDRCAADANAVLGDALGRAYVATDLAPGTKARVTSIADNIRATFHERIDRLGWMGDATKAEARRKLDAVLANIAYPARWRDYAGLTLQRDVPYAANVVRAMTFNTEQALAQIGHPVDRTAWMTTATTVDGFYRGDLNALFLPAAVLQAPRFDATGDDAVAYGSIGALIAHEFTHGFDDQGRQFDAEGALRDWWQPADAQHFTALSRRLVEQFSGYIAVDTMHVNGVLTLNENIADLGGVVIAYDAFQRSLAGKARPAPIDGYTAEQRFFLGYAQSWRRLYRIEARRHRALTDNHAPVAWRINGPLANIPEFARAFGCQAGTPMALRDDQRTAIW